MYKKLPNHFPEWLYKYTYLAFHRLFRISNLPHRWNVETLSHHTSLSTFLTLCCNCLNIVSPFIENTPNIMVFVSNHFMYIYFKEQVKNSLYYICLNLFSSFIPDVPSFLLLSLSFWRTHFSNFFYNTYAGNKFFYCFFIRECLHFSFIPGEYFHWIKNSGLITSPPHPSMLKTLFCFLLASWSLMRNLHSNSSSVSNKTCFVCFCFQ